MLTVKACLITRSQKKNQKSPSLNTNRGHGYNSFGKTDHKPNSSYSKRLILISKKLDSKTQS